MQKPIIAAIAAILLGTVPASSANAQVRAAPQSNSDNPVQCVRVTVHFTMTGLAFECLDPQGVPTHLFAVTDNQFPGRMEMVADLLLNGDLTQPGSGRTSGSRGLYVSHAEPNPAANRICRDAAPLDGEPECRLALDVIYRR